MNYKDFLTLEIPYRLEKLKTTHQAVWGKMNAQDMIEHLIASVTMSTIISQLPPSPPTPFQLEWKNKIILSDEPMPHFLENPLYKNGLPPHELPNLEAAKNKLATRTNDFFRLYEAKPEMKSYNGFFGLLDFEEWQRLHYKHFCHHLEQFELIKFPVLSKS